MGDVRQMLHEEGECEGGKLEKGKTHKYIPFLNDVQAFRWCAFEINHLVRTKRLGLQVECDVRDKLSAFQIVLGAEKGNLCNPLTMVQFRNLSP